MINKLKNKIRKGSHRLLLALGMEKQMARKEALRENYTSGESITPLSVDGPLPKISFLIGSSSAGLILYQNGSFHQLLKNKGYYGITHLGERWLAFHKTALYGSIVSFRLQGAQVTDVHVHLYGLSRGIHQIDMIGGRLMVTDTYNNSLLVYSNILQRKLQHWEEDVKKVFPNGKLEDGRASSNYNHFNSVFSYGGKIYLVAHNETYKTQKNSEIFELDMDLRLLEARSINGSNCHNIYKDSHTEIVCRSVEGDLLVNGQPKAEVGKFTRGVSVADDYIIFGGSEFQPDRSKRDSNDGYLYIADKDFNIQTKVVIANTQIQEIRRTDVADYGLSNMSKEAARA